MELIELTESDRPEYNNFVATNPSGSFLQAWEWGQWQESLGREVRRFIFTDENQGQNILASIQLIKMPLPFSRYYLYAPYGPVVDLRFKIEDLRFLIQELQKKFSDAVFVRIESQGEMLSTIHYPLVTKSPNIQPGKTLLLNLAKSEEELLAAMHPKTRYNIKVAQKHGVEVKEELEISIGHGLYFREAIDLICQTSKRQGFVAHPFNYYQDLIDMFALNKQSGLKAHLYKAIYQNQLLAAAIFIDFGSTRTFLFGGSGELHKNVMAPYLLHWQAMQDAKRLGLLTYDFWGIETSSGQTPGFVRFKLGFGGQEKAYAGAYDLINNKFGYKVYALFRAINKLKIKISSN